ncbi:MAG: UTP--glucose-1-phosphate uridylyltransferase [Verrucomicrobia bacterium]|nr:UTP--glucose-1-phosphate uridylyltransferase [Verrucomicrobiota bacterium]
MDIESAVRLCVAKMADAKVSPLAAKSFIANARKVAEGDLGLIPETEVEAIATLPGLDDLPEPSARASALLGELAVLKLNGGLGTGMGLQKAKSLLMIRDNRAFLDFIAAQIQDLRGRPGAGRLAFLLMNSFSTQADSLAYLERYSNLGLGESLDFLQSKVPKLDAQTLEPATWPDDPELEWCPPGHGDIYPSLVSSGVLDRLLKQGIRYLFVSNSDNLGASVDLRLLEHFARSGGSFLMEVAERTPSDRKGGHLARRKADGRLSLREFAQCSSSDVALFQDIARHRFFNTNNLWLRLDHLRDELEKRGGLLPLPLIRNEKTVDPTRKDSPKVLQLESAMGAAIECFERAEALVVPRTRFAPVKSTADLLVLRSDACRVTPDHRIELAACRRGVPPEVTLDEKFYRTIAAFERAFPQGVPSLAGCDRLKVKGPFIFAAGVICQGDVEWTNTGEEAQWISAGTYGAAS